MISSISIESGILDLPEAELLARAVDLRKKASGNRIELCAIVSIRSGSCGMDCKFCIQSARNRHFSGSPLLSDDELRSRIEKLAALPVRHIGLVASGKALSGSEFERLVAFVSRLEPSLKARLCASVGQLSADQLSELRATGISHYHHNLETSPDFYPRVCSTQTWEDRAATVSRAIAAGMEVCSGGLFGIGEEWEDRIALAKSLAELGVDNIPLNFLQPQPDTPFASSAPLPRSVALRIIALFRHMLPQAKLRICGGRPLVFGTDQKAFFQAGANALMTGDYLTTRGCALDCDLELLAGAGLVNDFPA